MVVAHSQVQNALLCSAARPVQAQHSVAWVVAALLLVGLLCSALTSADRLVGPQLCEDLLVDLCPPVIHLVWVQQ